MDFSGERKPVDPALTDEIRFDHDASHGPESDDSEIAQVVEGAVGYSREMEGVWQGGADLNSTAWVLEDDAKARAVTTSQRVPIDEKTAPEAESASGRQVVRSAAVSWALCG